jgi:hypothetical protein
MTISRTSGCRPTVDFQQQLFLPVRQQNQISPDGARERKSRGGFSKHEFQPLPVLLTCYHLKEYRNSENTTTEFKDLERNIV